MMDDNNIPNSASTNPFQLNLNEIRPANKTDEPVKSVESDTRHVIEQNHTEQTDQQESSLPEQSITESSVAQGQSESTYSAQNIASQTKTLSSVVFSDARALSTPTETFSVASADPMTSVSIPQQESLSTLKPNVREEADTRTPVYGANFTSRDTASQTVVSARKTATAANNETFQKPQSVGRFVVLAVIMVAVLIASYWETLRSLVNTWSVIIDYHHGFFVVPFVIYFLWMRRKTIPQKQSKTNSILGFVLGMTLLAVWAIARYYIMVYSMVTLDAWTILIWVCAVTLICFGFRIFLWALPSLLFLAFMFPWPQTFEMLLRPKLQEFAAQLSTYMLRIIGEPAIRQVNIIIMSDNQKLDVAAACSGIRVLISVIAAAYAAALLMRRPWWINVLLFCLVIPVALFVNALRITITGLLIKYASGFIDGFHFEKKTPVVCDDISGGIMLFLTFVIFICIILWIGKVFHRVEIASSPTNREF
ncbi:MAG: exosortase/archaeosortase family protein [Planctomycetaceae bacterium]|jgi:exosortase|nr:exosortase/archaeosortase family protein [Planctomycetaceae bacterium]